jgi:hypothetical protein
MTKNSLDQATQYSHILGAVFISSLASIFAKRYIKNAVEVIFHAPVITNNPGGPSCSWLFVFAHDLKACILSQNRYVESNKAALQVYTLMDL